MSEEKRLADQMPFRVRHDNGDILQGFDDLQSAQDDAADRNKRAKEFGLTCRYHAEVKP
jgi:hypothetical protein